MAPRKIPAPVPTPDTQEFWDAAAQGRFLIRRCKQCGKAHWYPRPNCPFCWGETAWVEASGRGVIYAYSVMRRAPEPYVIAYVTLEEGPTMLTNIVESEFDALAIGRPVRLRFSATEGGPPAPTFMIVHASAK
jgi:uncharacterized protein